MTTVGSVSPSCGLCNESFMTCESLLLCHTPDS